MISCVLCQPDRRRFVYMYHLKFYLKNLFFDEIIIIYETHMKELFESTEHISTIPSEQGALGIVNDVEEKFKEIKSNIDKVLDNKTDTVSNVLMDEYKEQLRSLAKKLAYVLIPETEPEHTIVQEKLTDIINRIDDTEGKLHILQKGLLSIDDISRED
jgi:hypothetical protein